MSAEKSWDAYYEFVRSQEPQYEVSGHLQWKGTDACLDLVCACGAYGHVDGFFLNRVKCAVCGRVYAIACTVKLVELPGEHRTFIRRHDKYIAGFGVEEDK